MTWGQVIVYFLREKNGIYSTLRRMPKVLVSNGAWCAPGWCQGRAGLRFVASCIVFVRLVLSCLLRNLAICRGQNAPIAKAKAVAVAKAKAGFITMKARPKHQASETPRNG